MRARAARSDHGRVTSWLNTPIRMQFRVLDGLTVRFAQSEDRDDRALLLSPWPDQYAALVTTWWTGGYRAASKEPPPPSPAPRL